MRHSSAPLRTLQRATGLFALAACTLIPLPQVRGVGQFGRAIPVVSDLERPLPRLAVGLYADACPGPTGGCTSFCDGRPSECAPGDCMPALIASGSPFTVMPTGNDYDVVRDCMEVRAAKGLEGTPSQEDLDAAVARFRFERLPIVRVPEDDAAGWRWQAGDDRQEMEVGAVLGGNLLKYFAVELRHQTGQDPFVAFFGVFPGSEPDLADQGRAFIRLQFPGRLVGRLVDDRCVIGQGESPSDPSTVDCELDEVDLRPDVAVLVYESTRMVVDACVGFSPCGVSWDLVDEPDSFECQLRPGGPDLDANCSDASDSGRSASLMVATGLPGLVLIENSADRMFGDLTALPACASLDENSDVGACVEDEVGRLHIPGYAPLEDLLRLRVRSLALVTGLDATSGPSPCTRLERRLEGARRQCEAFADERQPTRPGNATRVSFESSFAAFGETTFGDEQVAPDPEEWIETLVVSDSSPTMIAIRRDVGPEPVELDGLVGSVILRETETVLDYTEEEDKPGVRISCLDSEQCTVLPACIADDPANAEGGGAGRQSCCYGLPQDLLIETVQRGLDKEAPRVEDACCPALDPDVRSELQDLGLCTDSYIP